MSPLLLIGLLGASAYILTSKPTKSSLSSKDCGCGFKSFFKLSEDCTKIIGISDWVTKPQLLKADNNKINAYINSHKNLNIWQLTEDILTKRYGEKCYKATEEIQNFLTVAQFADIARVLYIYDHIDTWNYDQLIFLELWHWLQKKQLLTKYNGEPLQNDYIKDEFIIQGIIEAFKLYPKMHEKDSKGLAIPLYFGVYKSNDPKVFMFDYNLAPQISLERWNRYVKLVDQAKEQFKKGNKK